MLSEYLKLARSFNMALTGLAPVMGALAMGQNDIFHLFLLFVVGCLGHAYGFTHNDIVDYQHDIHVAEIAARPLIKGTISKKQAWLFAFFCLFVAGLVVSYLSITTGRYLSLGVFCLPVVCVTLYNYIGKRFPFMDVILALGMFFLILWGALTQTNDFYQVTFVTWIICFLGAIQVLYMNVIAGGLKDIKHDAQKGAQTTAVQLGVRITDTTLFIPLKFTFIAFFLQILNILAVFLPFIFDSSVRSSSLLGNLQISILLLTSFGMLFFVGKLLMLIQFERATVRRLIGIQYYLNFCLAPLLLLHLTLWAIVLICIPAFGFILSNLLLHEKFMEPEVM
jgi:4-hydroxybenzoate polyprenyltransferase